MFGQCGRTTLFSNRPVGNAQSFGTSVILCILEQAARVDYFDKERSDNRDGGSIQRDYTRANPMDARDGQLCRYICIIIFTYVDSEREFSIAVYWPYH